MRHLARDPRTWGVVGVLVIFAIAFGVTLYSSSTRMPQGTVRLNVLGGAVEVATRDVSGSATDGQILFVGATVRSQAPDGRAILTFPDGSTTELEPGAAVRIDEVSLGTRGELIVRLTQGSGITKSDVQSLVTAQARFHIRTPTATAVVRGTSFEVHVTESPSSTLVAVMSGKVDLVASGAVTSVPEGHSAEVVDGGPPGPAKPLAREP